MGFPSGGDNEKKVVTEVEPGPFGGSIRTKHVVEGSQPGPFGGTLYSFKKYKNKEQEREAVEKMEGSILNKGPF